MAERLATLDDILAQTRLLRPRDRVRLIERLAADLEADMTAQSADGRSLQGLWAGLGTAPSDDSLGQVRHEAWATFPRDSIVDQDG